MGYPGPYGYKGQRGDGARGMRGDPGDPGLPGQPGIPASPMKGQKGDKGESLPVPGYNTPGNNPPVPPSPMTGYVPPPGPVTVRRCTRDNGGCTQGCIDYPFGANCTCREGYQLDLGDFKTCVDIDECSMQNGGCQQKCANTVGTFYCSCNPGFTLGVDGKRCFDTDECSTSEVNPCGPGYLCIKTAGPKQCLPADSFVAYKPSVPILARDDNGNIYYNSSPTTVLPTTSSTSTKSTTSIRTEKPTMITPRKHKRGFLTSRSIGIILIIWLVTLTIAITLIVIAVVMGFYAMKESFDEDSIAGPTPSIDRILPQPLTIPRIIETDSVRN